MLPAQLVDAARQSNITLVIGEKDTGKTHFVTMLANALFRQGQSVGIIDTDIGQSGIGPPATVGFGRVKSELQRLHDTVAQQVYFVGSPSPRGHLLPLLIGTRRMLDKAQKHGLQNILIDTTGLVAGPLGYALKTQKIDLVAPDLVMCFQHRQECEHILTAYAPFRTPRILRCRPAAQCHPKTGAMRRAHRIRMFQRAFLQAHECECSLADIGLLDSILFHGQPMTSHQLSTCSEFLVKNAQAINAPEAEIHPDVPRLMWGEYCGKEMHLVSAEPLHAAHRVMVKNALRKVRTVKNYTPDDFKNLLVGVLDARRECRAVGILRALDFVHQTARVYTTLAPQEIVGLVLSRYRAELD